MPLLGQDRCPDDARAPVSSRAVPSYLSRQMTSTGTSDSSEPAGTRDQPVPAPRRAIDWAVALLWLAAVVAATLQQGVAHENNNFLIFRAASRHLLAGLDLYAAYPA